MKEIDDGKTMSGIKCKKCKDEIFSLHVHDFKTCECGAVSVDGGREYCKIVADDFENVEIIKKNITPKE